MGGREVAEEQDVLWKLRVTGSPESGLMLMVLTLSTEWRNTVYLEGKELASGNELLSSHHGLNERKHQTAVPTILERHLLFQGQKPSLGNLAQLTTRGRQHSWPHTILNSELLATCRPLPPCHPYHPITRYSPQLHNSALSLLSSSTVTSGLRHKPRSYTAEPTESLGWSITRPWFESQWYHLQAPAFCYREEQERLRATKDGAVGGKLTAQLGTRSDTDRS